MPTLDSVHQRVKPPALPSKTSDDVDLHQRVAWNTARRGDGRAYRWLRAEAPKEYFVHGRIIFEVVEVHVALQHLFHRRSARLELLLDRVEHMLGVGLDVSLEMGADSGDEQQVSIRDCAAEQRRLFGTFAISPEHLLRRLFLCVSRRGCDRGRRSSSGEPFP